MLPVVPSPPALHHGKCGKTIPSNLNNSIIKTKRVSASLKNSRVPTSPRSLAALPCPAPLLHIKAFAIVQWPRAFGENYCCHPWQIIRSSNAAAQFHDQADPHSDHLQDILSGPMVLTHRLHSKQLLLSTPTVDTKYSEESLATQEPHLEIDPYWSLFSWACWRSCQQF